MRGTQNRGKKEQIGDGGRAGRKEKEMQTDNGVGMGGTEEKRMDDGQRN